MWRGALHLQSSARALIPKTLLLKGKNREFLLASKHFAIVFEKSFNDKLRTALVMKTFRARCEITLSLTNHQIKEFGLVKYCLAKSSQLKETIGRKHPVYHISRIETLRLEKASKIESIARCKFASHPNPLLELMDKNSGLVTNQ